MADERPAPEPETPTITISNDGELAPVLATIARAYAQLVQATDKLRRRILSDKDRAARRAELTDQLVARVGDLARAIAELARLDAVKPPLRTLSQLPEAVRPRSEEVA